MLIGEGAGNPAIILEPPTIYNANLSLRANRINRSDCPAWVGISFSSAFANFELDPPPQSLRDVCLDESGRRKRLKAVCVALHLGTAESMP